MPRITGTLSFRVNTPIKTDLPLRPNVAAGLAPLAYIGASIAREFSRTALRELERARQNMISEGSPIHSASPSDRDVAFRRESLALASASPPARC